MYIVGLCLFMYWNGLVCTHHSILHSYPSLNKLKRGLKKFLTCKISSLRIVDALTASGEAFEVDALCKKMFAQAFAIGFMGVLATLVDVCLGTHFMVFIGGVCTFEDERVLLGLHSWWIFGV